MYEMKLGRLPHNSDQIARMPQYSNVLAKLPGNGINTAPYILDRSNNTHFRPGLDGNDRIGNCTAVGLANAARASAAIHGDFILNIDPSAATAFYSNSCGYVPGNPATDMGGVEANVLAYQAMYGFDGGPALQVPLVADFFTWDPADLNATRTVAYLFGSAYLGVALAQVDQYVFDVGDVWDTDITGTASDQTVGSLGGHCVLAWDWTGTNDDDLVCLITWGAFQHATWRWVKSRCQESHALLFRQLSGPHPGGFDYDRLRADMDLFLTASPKPT